MSCDLKGQEDLGGNEAESKQKASETDYYSGDEEVLTKADTLKRKEKEEEEEEEKEKKKGGARKQDYLKTLLRDICAWDICSHWDRQNCSLSIACLGATDLQALLVLVLVPTRELGIQVHSVTKQLAQFCSITTCLAVGGLDVKSQEAALQTAPNIRIATPGWVIDHLHNCPSFLLSNIEVLILDEADRMLDEYFEEQMKEIIPMCFHHRQTILFSATMTDEVKDLTSVSLKNPVQIFVNNTDVAPLLWQEFLRIRPKREEDREAIVAALQMKPSLTM
ncbi:putative ATP-dependent RNA helicase DDX27 [Sigmodon hispidus]